MSSVDRLFSEMRGDLAQIPSLLKRPSVTENLLVAMSIWQLKTGKDIKRTEMFVAKTRITGRVTLKSSLTANIDEMKKSGFIERVDRGVYRVTDKGHKEAKRLKKEKTMLFGG